MSQLQGDSGGFLAEFGALLRAHGSSEDGLAGSREQSNGRVVPSGELPQRSEPGLDEIMELLADRIAAKLAPRELPELLTSADLAGLLSVDRKTVSRWRQDGLLPPALHVGRTLRWKRADVARWLDGLEVG